MHKDWIGKRVEVPVHFDAWMRGARFGTVTAYRQGSAGVSDVLLVRLDHPSYRKCLRIPRMDWEYMKPL